MSATKQTRFIYKCRKCGKLDDSLGTGANPVFVTQLLVKAIMELESEHAQAPKLLTLHYCNENETGVADLVGSEVRPLTLAAHSANKPSHEKTT